ncbi:hypothetical protein, partial [Nonomuraea endophytica]|uniref:hypothetical protein n=1 Tax=Nonomuraea endophytica TaxID=714136 RepID=UPI001C8510D0
AQRQDRPAHRPIPHRLRPLIVSSRLGINHLDEKYEITEVREFHLDAVVSEYRLHRVHRDRLELELPILVAVPLVELVAP